jgi:hypothetical protein
MKQARAFGLGVVLATQNPVDLTARGSATRAPGHRAAADRRDKARVIEGLLGTDAAGGLDRPRSTR